MIELSTQFIIDEAKKRGYIVEILDETANFIRISKNGKTEYIRQASKTRLDSYITSELLGNKKICKQIMHEAGISAPLGLNFTDVQLAKNSYEEFIDKQIVIKPNTTNYGTGISIFQNKFTKKDYDQAIELAFTYDAEVLVEEFAEGTEARFLVVDEKCIAVLQRIPANITGNGTNTINELIEIKNKDPRRGDTYSSPFQKIKLDSVSLQFLEEQNVGPNYVPKNGEQIFLRKNSNISTGGESIDLTDLVHDSYKQKAVQAAKAVGAMICGVDLIAKSFSEQVSDSNYKIIELNYNPALFIHNLPYIGQNRSVDKHIIDALEKY